MTKIINSKDLLKHNFTKCVLDAFQHLEFVKQIKATNNVQPLLDGYSLPDFAASDMSYEEYFVRNLFRKAENLQVDGHDAELDTIVKFKGFLKEQETHQVRVMALLEKLDDSTSFGRVMLAARERMHEVFADFNEIYDVKPRFTSGASLTLPRVKASSPFERFKASEGSEHLRRIFDRRRKEGIVRFSFTDRAFPQTRGTDDFYTALECVPKYWYILRIIGKNPTSVMACQAGIGDWMTYRAKSRLGIDITTAQDKHKNLARLASLVDSYLMTADQSEASDRILRILVEWLIPNNVYQYLVDVTPTQILLPDGTSVHTHMMAPAGNGYIFPLQTILFHTLAYCVCKEMKVKPEVYSYGDDLIAPSAIYTQLNQVFNLLGLKVNPNKTFRSGSARESCGGDYILGSDVRPLYVKHIPSTVTEWFSVINGIRRVGHDNNLGCWRTNNFRRLWLWCISNVPKSSRLFAPCHFGDTAIGTSDQRWYHLIYKTKYFDGTRMVKYPNGGLREGIPYSGWYININATKSAGKGETYPEHTKGIKQHNLLRLTSLESVRGAGDTLRTFTRGKDGKLLSEPLLKYSYSPFFNRDERVIQRIAVPLTLACPAPSDNIEDLFDHLGPDNPIVDTDGVIQRCQNRYTQAYGDLLGILRSRLHLLMEASAAVESMDLDF